MVWSPYKESMRHFFGPYSYSDIQRKFSPSSYFFEKGLEEPKVCFSFFVSQQWLEVCVRINVVQMIFKVYFIKYIFIYLIKY